MATVNGYVVLTGVVEEEGSQFVSYCRELGTSSCGDTVVEAFENLHDAIRVHLDALVESGELVREFRERNIRIESDPVLLDDVLIRVPRGKIITAYQQKISVPA